jgi:hypothetical protein
VGYLRPVKAVEQRQESRVQIRAQALQSAGMILGWTAKISLVDYPGNRLPPSYFRAVAYFRARTAHNPELVWPNNMLRKFLWRACWISCGSAAACWSGHPHRRRADPAGRLPAVAAFNQGKWVSRSSWIVTAARPWAARVVRSRLVDLRGHGRQGAFNQYARVCGADISLSQSRKHRAVLQGRVDL